MADRSDVQLHNGNYRVVLYPGHTVRRGNCRDCRHCQGFVTWWCRNEAAVEHYQSCSPERVDCPFWEEAVRISEPFLRELKYPKAESAARSRFLSHGLFVFFSLALAALALFLWSFL